MKAWYRSLSEGRWAAEWLLAATVWIGGNYLAAWRLGLPAVGAVFGLWIAGWLVGEALRHRNADRAGRAFIVELALAALLWWCLPANVCLHLPWAAYVCALGLIAIFRVALWSRLRRADREGWGAGEAWRLVLVAGAALWVASPLLTDRFLGGTDAIWYAYVADDYREQLREGVFPVFVGQGANIFNGGIHPIRSAPAYTFIVGGWDLLTARALPLFSLQHLAALTAAFAGTFAMYSGLNRLRNGSRWLAALVSVLYTTTPAVLAGFYSGDMYMTYLAVAVLPWVVCGNAESVQTSGRRGLLFTAAALALAWMCHPPTAMYATLLTVFLQAGRLALQRDLLENWRQALVAGAAVVAFSAHYFWAMGERPDQSVSGGSSAVLQTGGLLLGFVGLARGWMTGRWRWGGLAAAGLAALWLSSRAFFWFLAAGTAAVALAAVLARRWPAEKRERLTWAVLFGSAAAAAFGAAWALRGEVLPVNDQFLAGLDHNASRWRELLRPVAPDAMAEGNSQPGWALLACFGAGLLHSFGRSREKHRAAGMLAAAGALLILFVWPVGPVARFVIGNLPTDLAYVMGIPMTVRLLPTWCAIAAVLGFLAAASIASAGGWRKVALVSVAILLAGWSASEARKFVARGFAITAPGPLSQQHLMPENRVVHRFVYDLLRLPDYYTHGGNDWRLESRLLRMDQTELAGPAEAAARMERRGSRAIEWGGRPLETGLAWVDLQPRLTIPANTTLLLRFEFPEEVAPGYLIFKGEHFYREFALPASGLPKAFGSGPENGKVLTLGNSSPDAAEITVFFVRNAIPAGTTANTWVHFAKITASRFDPEMLPVRVRSLIPYRAQLTLPEDGFLETPRVMLPGYVATVDGKPADVRRSNQGLVMIPLKAGAHEVDLRFVGTRALRLTYGLSAGAWLAAGLWLAIRCRPRPGTWFSPWEQRISGGTT